MLQQGSDLTININRERDTHPEGKRDAVRVWTMPHKTGYNTPDPRVETGTKMRRNLKRFVKRTPAREGRGVERV